MSDMPKELWVRNRINLYGIFAAEPHRKTLDCVRYLRADIANEALDALRELVEFDDLPPLRASDFEKWTAYYQKRGDLMRNAKRIVESIGKGAK